MGNYSETSPSGQKMLTTIVVIIINEDNVLSPASGIID